MVDRNWLLKAEISKLSRKELEKAHLDHYLLYYETKGLLDMVEDAADYWQDEAEELKQRLNRFETLWEQTIISMDEYNRLSSMFRTLDNVVNDPDACSDDVYDFARDIANEWEVIEDYLQRIV